MINNGFGTARENTNFQLYNTLLGIRFPRLKEYIEAYLTELTEGTWDNGTRTIIFPAIFREEPILVINYFRNKGNRSEAYVYTDMINEYFHQYADDLREYALTEGVRVREGVSNELKLS